MTGARHRWPRKTRELRNHHLDSSMWNRFKFRDGDIVIATYAKSGTTWMQQIVAELLFDDTEALDIKMMSPWIDYRLPSWQEKRKLVEAQTHRRFVKTHLPVDALRFSPRARYIYIGRDGRDVALSLYNHYAKGTDEMYWMLNDAPGRVGPPIPRPPACPREYFRAWLDGDGYPLWSFWENVRSWWDIRDLPNVLLVNYARLKRDLPGEIGRIASFLGIHVDEARIPSIVDHCSFDYMLRHGERIVPVGGSIWEGGVRDFMHRGQAGRWREVLSAEEGAAYEARAHAELGEVCAGWLANG